MWVKKLVIVVFEEGGIRIGRVAVARGHCERGKGERELALLVDRQLGQFDLMEDVRLVVMDHLHGRAPNCGDPRGLTRC